MDTPSLLIVSTHKSWIADHFRAANLCPVRLDHGFDAPTPTDPATTAWWTPTEHAARLLHAGMNIPFQTPGPELLAQFHPDHLQRDIWVGTLSDMPRYPSGGFFKLAEAKTDKLPAAWWNSSDDFTAAALAANIPNDSILHVTSQRLTFTWEFRCFITRSTVTAVSPYAAPDGTVFPCTPAPQTVTDEAAQFATQATRALPCTPDGWVLDVGLTADHGWVVIETNPAWSANPYDCDPAGVVHAVTAATLPPAGGGAPDFLWEPDPLIHRYATSRPMLRKTTLTS